MLAKGAQQILGQVENKTLVSDFGSSLWPQELAFEAHTTRLPMFVSPFIAEQERGINPHVTSPQLHSPSLAEMEAQELYVK